MEAESVGTKRAKVLLLRIIFEKEIKPKNTTRNLNSRLNHPPPGGSGVVIFGLAYNLFYHKRNEYLRFSSEKTWGTWAINLQKITKLNCRVCNGRAITAN